MEQIPSPSLSGELILIRQPLLRTMRREVGSGAKKMTNGTYSGHFLGLSRISSTLTLVTEWVKCSK